MIQLDDFAAEMMRPQLSIRLLDHSIQKRLGRPPTLAINDPTNKRASIRMTEEEKWDFCLLANLISHFDDSIDHIRLDRPVPPKQAQPQHQTHTRLATHTQNSRSNQDTIKQPCSARGSIRRQPRTPVLETSNRKKKNPSASLPAVSSRRKRTAKLV